MKIGKLEQHCGECNLIDLCGEPYSDICICSREEVSNMEEEDYRKKVAEIRANSKRNWSNKTLLKRIISE